MDKERHSNNNLHPAESKPNTVPGTISKWQVSACRTLLDLLLFETFRNELFRLRIELRIMMDAQGGNQNSSALFNGVLGIAGNIGFRCRSNQMGHNRMFPQGF